MNVERPARISEDERHPCESDLLLGEGYRGLVGKGVRQKRLLRNEVTGTHAKGEPKAFQRRRPRFAPTVDDMQVLLDPTPSFQRTIQMVYVFYLVLTMYGLNLKSVKCHRPLLHLLHAYIPFSMGNRQKWCHKLMSC